MKQYCKSDKHKVLEVTYFSQIILVLCSVVFFMACQQPTGKIDKEKTEKKADSMTDSKKVIYYCPMHPEVEQDHPGKCDKCNGMELIIKEPQELLNTVLKAVNSSVLSNLKTVKPQKKELAKGFETSGYIDYDERTKHNITSRFDGRIEKLYIKYNYQPIHKGEKIFEIYSPELVTAQDNLIYLLKNSSNDLDLINAAKQKLRILEMTDKQIEHLVETKNVQTSITVYSKYDGIVFESKNKASDKKAGSNQSMGMVLGNSVRSQQNGNSTEESTTSNSQLSIKDGMYITSEQVVFNVIDLNNLAVMLQIRGKDISKIKLNQKVNIEFSEIPKTVLSEKIDFIEPSMQADIKSLIARVYINNMSHAYKVGTLVKAIIQCDEVEGLWIPLSSVIDLGKSKIVWLKKSNRFIAQKIETGNIINDMIEVTDGLTMIDEIAVEGHYLTDSEGFIKVNNNDNEE